MANPAIVACTQSAWVKVATNVLSGNIRIMKSGMYLVTYRLTGQAAPANDNDAVVLDDGEIIQASAGIDVYVKAVGQVGSVRVSV
jgi:hypothetical protein